MGICYTYLLYDDFDWDYSELTKDEVIHHIKLDYPVATILAQWPHYIVVDMDKTSPYGDRIQSLLTRADKVYVYDDMEQGELTEVKSKERKSNYVTDNPSKHRNQVFIDQANAEWNAKHKQTVHASARTMIGTSYA